ncbi:MAG: exopolysaccharide transport family protein, partial [Thermodesulfobacteriota bacterium]|nr:exopolysaccharide transport family protein [Thermodesulfobacteriota bacterium]
MMAVLFRRKWPIIAVLLSAVIPVIAYTLTKESVYATQSRILVKPGRENIYVSPVGAPEGAHPPTIIQRVNEVINSEIEIIRSRELIRRVVEEVGVSNIFPLRLPKDSKNSMIGHRGESFPRRFMGKIGIAGVFSPALSEESGAQQGGAPPPLEIAVNRALAGLKVRRIKGTDVIEIRFVSNRPEVPAQFVTALVDLYLERHLEVHQSRQSYDFFKAQAEQLEGQLATAGRRLVEFKKKYGIVSFDEWKSITLRKFADVEGLIRTTDAAIVTSEKKLDKLRADLARIPEHGYHTQSESTDPGVINSLKAKLANLELEKLQLAQRFRPENQKLVNINGLIARTKELLAAEEEKFHGSVTTGVNSIYRELDLRRLTEEATIEALKSKKKELEEDLVELGQRLERQGLLEPELLALKRAVQINEQTYRLYVTKFEESRVRNAMDAAKMVSVSVLEPARPPIGPVPVNRALNIVVSICLGSLAAFGMAFLLEYFDQTYKVPEDIRDNLSVPVLGAIRDLPRKEMEAIEALAISPKSPLYYQTIKSNVVMRADEKGMNVLSLCSATPEEGCSTVLINLGAALVKDSQCRVVLVDANFRHPSLHKSFDLPARPGFSDVVQDGTDVL